MNKHREPHRQHLSITGTTLLGAAIGAAGVASSASLMGASSVDKQSAYGTASMRKASDGTTEICFLNDAPYFSALAQGCYPQSIIQDLRTRDLVNRRGATISVTLSSPPAAPEAEETCTSCEDYEQRRRLGWFALTNRDQRREAFFERACGFLTVLEKGEVPEQTFFAGGRLSRDDLASLESRSVFQMAALPPARAAQSSISEGTVASTNDVAEMISSDNAENTSEATTSSNAWAIEADGDSWSLSLPNQSVRFEPLVHADFNNDGLGDILVYMAAQMTEGTANQGELAVLTKLNLGGAITIVSLDELGNASVKDSSTASTDSTDS